tara:strand:+ start:113 stop:454 length:342 start_codon:yes stop_codon:yes gene_type:complete
MTPTPEDANVLAKILGGLGTTVAVVGGWLLKHTHDKIDTKVDKDAYADRGKANDEKHLVVVAEVVTQRENVRAIFVDIAEFKKDTAHQFACLNTKLDSKHIDLLKAIHDIGKK